MKKLLTVCLTLGALAISPAFAEVVRPAPDLLFSGAAGGKVTSLKALRGQPVVLVIAASPRQGAFKEQAEQLEELYRLLAGREAVFIAAFSTTNEDKLKSNIPFAVAQNGPAVAASYGVPPGKFALAVIGEDGNLDLLTRKVSRAERVLEVIDNAYPVQAASRKY
jgi:peroxiredoxin